MVVHSAALLTAANADSTYYMVTESDYLRDYGRITPYLANKVGGVLLAGQCALLNGKVLKVVVTRKMPFM